MRVALVTWSGLPELSRGDQSLRDALLTRGATVDATVWDDRGVSWREYDRIVIRSTWDYHKRAGEFAAWIDAIEAMGAPLWNPPRLLRKNMHKGYLLDLEARGVPIVPTELVARRALRPPGAAAEAAAAPPRIVVKPAISATAFRTLVDPDDAAFAALAAETDVLIQPFLREVVDHGEWSLIFLGGQFSHAVLKRPRAGDFRVQTDFGGTAERVEASASLIEQARRVLDAVDEPWLYARVDGVVVDGRFLLMELEMLEPDLFLDAASAAFLAELLVAGFL